MGGEAHGWADLSYLREAEFEDFVRKWLGPAFDLPIVKERKLTEKLLRALVGGACTDFTSVCV